MIKLLSLSSFIISMPFLLVKGYYYNNMISPPSFPQVPWGASAPYPYLSPYYYPNTPFNNQLITRDPHPTLLIKRPNGKSKVYKLNPKCKIGKNLLGLDLNQLVRNILRAKESSKHGTRTGSKRPQASKQKKPKLIRRAIEPPRSAKTRPSTCEPCHIAPPSQRVQNKVVKNQDPKPTPSQRINNTKDTKKHHYLGNKICFPIASPILNLLSMLRPVSVTRIGYEPSIICYAATDLKAAEMIV